MTRYRLETGGLRLELFDGGSYLHAVVPVPDCLSRRTRARDDIAAAWKQLLECIRPIQGWQPLGAIGYVRGIGFWSQRRMLRGSAPNGAELHPVTGVRVVVGC